MASPNCYRLLFTSDLYSPWTVLKFSFITSPVECTILGFIRKLNLICQINTCHTDLEYLTCLVEIKQILFFKILKCILLMVISLTQTSKIGICFILTNFILII
ncbi:hypothetical protein BpHYR1_031082 [Brachionus plicatilis]|uniref:Uncharacterized protein n=1 Tax=Brachionus plicatilis TaxID=10195 RepID=A0A3M7RHV5_BRAPC|nr:hypothetical protein BpHYR1_031082 [Brachionus plicatilis]